MDCQKVWPHFGPMTYEEHLRTEIKLTEAEWRALHTFESVGTVKECNETHARDTCRMRPSSGLSLCSYKPRQVKCILISIRSIKTHFLHETLKYMFR